MARVFYCEKALKSQVAVKTELNVPDEAERKKNSAKIQILKLYPKVKVSSLLFFDVVT